MIFEKVPIKVYENFHKMFSGVNEDIFVTCQECKGACEHNKIGTLLPGEKEYMAKKMDIDVNEFKTRYLDILRMEDGTQLNVLKLGKLCPFLNEETKECECRDFKPIFCKVYPVVFTVESETVRFSIDSWCKLSNKEDIRTYFENVIPLLMSLPIPQGWFSYVACYDNFSFDYSQLEKNRRREKYNSFSLDHLLEFKKVEVETASLCINIKEEAEKSIS